MSHSLSVLEAQRATIQHQISQLGDLRTGSITNYRGPLRKFALPLPKAGRSGPWAVLPPYS